MAKLNEGDVIEGIFALALALYISDGKIDKTKLNKARMAIDPSLFSSGRVRHTIAKNVKRHLPNKPPDFFNIGVEIRLKPESVSGAFGKNYKVLYESSRDVGDLDKKINQLIRHIDGTQFGKQAHAAVLKFLQNNKPEIVDFVVVSDGIAGEASGGAVKGDVTLDIYVKGKSSKKKIHQSTIPFSLKSGSVTVANLSPYNGMLAIASGLKIKWTAKEKYARLAQPFNGATEQKQKFQIIEKMYSDLQKEVQAVSKSPGFSHNAFAFLRKSIFGTDLANVVDVRSGMIKEITVEYFDKLTATTKLDVVKKGNNLVFVDKNSKAPIFQLRTKLRKEANEAKFYLEVGSGIYSH